MIVKFFSWDQPRNVICAFKDVSKGDCLVVEHEWGTLLAEVLCPGKSLPQEEPSGRVIRKATAQDREMALNYRLKQEEYLSQVRNEIRDFVLPMKVVEIQCSLDGGVMVIAFLADGRVDFRGLVKTLSTKFQKTVRFQQIGSRDEAKRVGGYGICGREVCCRNVSGTLKSITTEMARDQLISHRGSDRISGVCGRLMCCLAFEADQYQEMLNGMPQKGEIVQLKDGKSKARVVDLFVLKDKIKVETEDGKYMEVKRDEIIDQRRDSELK